MKILAIDTSSKVLGVAVLDENGQEAEFNYSFGLRHTSHLIPTIKLLLKLAGLGLEDIDGYCVSIGPGSFTGLRIGVSTVKALALVSKKKVAAVPSLDVLAYNIPDTEDLICVVVDAKKEKLYAAFYEYKKSGLKRKSPYLLIGYDDLLKRIRKFKDVILVGDGIEKLQTPNSPGPPFVALAGAGKLQTVKAAAKEFWHPRAINAARIGLEMLKTGKTVKDIDKLAPVYLYPRDVQCRK